MVGTKVNIEQNEDGSFTVTGAKESKSSSKKSTKKKTEDTPKDEDN